MDVDYIAEDQPERIVPKGLKRTGIAPSPFEISLMTYPTKPWENKMSNLSEWFNYGFNPTTWTKYCIDQMTLFKASNEMK